VGLCLFGAGTAYACKRSFDYSNFVYLLCGMLFIAVLLCCLFALKKLNLSAYCDKLVYLFSGVYFIVLCIVTYHYYFYTGWDAGYTIIPNSVAVATGNWGSISHAYFSWYPNNVFLVFIYSLLVKFAMLFHISDWYMLIIVFQCFIYATVAVMVYEIGKLLLHSKRYAVLAYALYIVLVGLSPWVVIPYSDSVGLLFPAFILLMYLKIKNMSQDNAKKLVYLALLIMLMYFGYKIKPQIGIITIAIALYELCNLIHGFMRNKNTVNENVRKSKTKKPQKQTAGIGVKAGVIVGSLLVSMLCMNVITHATHIMIDKERSLGIEHFLMMGMHPETKGVYAEEDVIFSINIPNKDERHQATMEQIKTRLDDYGIGGIANLAKSKLLTAYNDGTFAWELEGPFYVEQYAHGNSSLRAFLENFYCRDGKYQNIFFNIVQSIWMAVLVCGIFAVFLKKDFKVDILLLTIVGLTIYEVLFEVRARYLLTNVPLYILLAVIGVKTMMIKLAAWKGNKQV